MGRLRAPFLIMKEGRQKMRVIMYQQRFKGSIKSGRKHTTIRPTPKREVVVGWTLSHRVWTGAPCRSKQEVLREAPCLSVTPIEIRREKVLLEGAELNENEVRLLAFADGFDNAEDFFLWFETNHRLPFAGILIAWQNEIEAKES